MLKDRKSKTRKVQGTSTLVLILSALHEGRQYDLTGVVIMVVTLADHYPRYSCGCRLYSRRFIMPSATVQKLTVRKKKVRKAGRFGC